MQNIKRPSNSPHLAQSWVTGLPSHNNNTIAKKTKAGYVKMHMLFTTLGIYAFQTTNPTARREIPPSCKKSRQHGGDLIGLALGKLHKADSNLVNSAAKARHAWRG
eukprot:363506-Chlamydomonas_euryale.AAC.11